MIVIFSPVFHEFSLLTTSIVYCFLVASSCKSLVYLFWWNWKVVGIYYKIVLITTWTLTGVSLKIDLLFVCYVFCLLLYAICHDLMVWNPKPLEPVSFKTTFSHVFINFSSAVPCSHKACLHLCLLWSKGCASDSLFYLIDKPTRDIIIVIHNIKQSRRKRST